MSNNSVPGIYIHRAHSECTNPDLFRDTFNRVLSSDCVRCVDLVKKKDKNDIPFVRAFIHFKFWPRGETADKLYNELMSDKRLEITYNTETNWFWRFCRSKLPARDDLNATPRKNRPRKARYGDDNSKKKKKNTTHDEELPLPVPVLKRNTAIVCPPDGYIESSKRVVSNKPAWMNAEQSLDEGKLSDDGEDFEDYSIPNPDNEEGLCSE